MKTSRREKIRLVKDLEEGENKLCQSLVDIRQFQSLDHIFKAKKKEFEVSDKQIQLEQYEHVEQEEGEYDMTPTQKLEIYRKQKIKEKYHERYDKKQTKVDTRIFKVRKSKIPTILNTFNQKVKFEEGHKQSKYAQEIKLSEEKLKFIRSYGKASNNRSNINQGQLSKQITENRCRFYSLKNGLPEKNQKLFPTFAEYVEGKNRAKMQQKYTFNVDQIKNSISAFYTEVNPQENNTTRISKRKMSVNKQKLALISNLNEKKQGNNIQSQRARTSVDLRQKQIFRTEPLKIKRNQRQFHSSLYFYSQDPIVKSEKSSSNMVKTMTNFYNSKSKKQKQYDNMVDYYDHDRFLTNSIRRKQYGISIRSQKTPRQKNKGLMQCRNRSEACRKRILEQNSNTYQKILVLLTSYHQDDIPVALTFLTKLRQLMNKQYNFTQHQVKVILDDILAHEEKSHARKEKSLVTNSSQEGNQMERMFKVQQMLQVLNKSYGFDIHLK